MPGRYRALLRSAIVHDVSMRGNTLRPIDKPQGQWSLRSSGRGYGGVGTSFVVPTVASSVDLVVQIGIEPNGSRRIREIVALPGRVEAGVVETADIFSTVDGKLVRAQGFPPHPDRFARYGIDLPKLLSDGNSGRHQT